jgi:putative MATE family efflux protein
LLATGNSATKQDRTIPTGGRPPALKEQNLKTRDETVPAPKGGGNPLLARPILPTLLALATPNVIALGIQSLVTVAETTFIGMLGTEALAAMALVFPFVMLTQQMSSGAMGGGISSAIARALGAGQQDRAQTLALHAISIGLTVGVVFSALFLLAGNRLYGLLGGTGTVLAEALRYSTAFFSGALLLWLYNTLISVVRGTGNMRLASATMICAGMLQIALGGALCLGLGPFPRLGIVGVALGQILSAAAAAAFLFWYLAKGPSRLRVVPGRFALMPDLFRDILKVGAVACLSPVQSILTVVLLARFVASFGTAELAGFGIGVRLELLLVPIVFAIGVACVPMVGMAIGAGQVGRARRVAWTGAALSGLLIGAIGVMFAIWPGLWAGVFTSSEPVLAAAGIYLGIAGFAFPAYGVGLCLYFASQGSGKIVGPVLAGTVRLVVVILGGWLVFAQSMPFSSLAGVVAAGMLAYGVAAVAAVWLTPWGAR